MAELSQININLDGQNINNQLYLTYVFTPCCGGAKIRLKPSSVNLLTGVYIFDENNLYTDPEIGLVSTFCYTLTQEFISDFEVYNSLSTTPYQEGSVFYWSQPGDFELGCNSTKCIDCENYPNLGTFLVQACCDENFVFQFHIYEYPQEEFPLVQGYTFEYTGDVIPNGCYTVGRQGGQYLEAVFPFLEIEDFITQSNCETPVCLAYCPQELCYTLVNCFEDITINVQFTSDTEVNVGDIIAINLPESSTIELPSNNCWTVTVITPAESICLQFESEPFSYTLTVTPTSYDSEGRPIYDYNFTIDTDLYSGTIYWNNNRWENYVNNQLVAYILNPDKPVSTGTVYNWIIESEISGLTIITTLGECICDLEIIANPDFIEVTSANVNDFFTGPTGIIFNSNGLTQSDIIGNFYYPALLGNIPGNLTGIITTTGAIGTLSYFWEILNQSGTFSNVSIVDPNVLNAELIQTGPSAGDPFIRLKLTVTDSEGCEAEIIFFTYGFN
jgi:hypothetical protein